MKIWLHQHGGSGNRGCEAIVRSTIDILRHSSFHDISVFSAHPEEDALVKLDEIASIVMAPAKSIPELPLPLRALARIWKFATGSERLYYTLTAGAFRSHSFKGEMALHVGGDHYCYEGGEEYLALHNKHIKDTGGISVLWGASIEEKLLQKPLVRQDMMTYDAIFVRESISYDALRAHGIKHVHLVPDPAFALPCKETTSSLAIGNNVVGINFSPYAMGLGDIGMANYACLIQWILNQTVFDILLIPHVFKSHSNDINTLTKLMKSLPQTSRISMVGGKPGTMELKGIISKCRFFVGARTHSTIAAYSTCIPTLVLGYSVKANGIAKDIFGSFEDYVVNINQLKTQYCLLNHFKKIIDNEDNIRRYLNNFMPGYVQKAWEAGAIINNLATSKSTSSMSA